MIKSILLTLTGIVSQAKSTIKETSTMKAVGLILSILLPTTGTAALINHRLTANEPNCGNAVLQQVADANVSTDRVVGEVTEVDGANNRVVIKTDVGNVVTVLFNEKTECLRVSPGESSLEKSVKISLSEIRVGDKVYARGRLGEDRKSVPAQKLIVMSKTDIDKRRARDQQEWSRRGIVGSITAINPKIREVSLQVRGREGVRTVVATVPESCGFRRYAQGSVRFSDAQPSSFVELKVGDQVYARGERSADGSRFTAEQVVSGSFRLIGGTVTAVRSESSEISVMLLDGKHEITVVVNGNSALRHMPAQLAMAFAQINRSVQQGAPTAQAQQAAGRGSGGVGQSPSGRPGPTGAQPQQSASRSAPAAQADSSSGNRWGMDGDFRDLLERLPKLTFSQIKPGDVVAVCSTSGQDPSRLTAITLVTGIDVVLNALQRSGDPRRPANVITGLPFGVFDLGIGLQ